MPADAPPEVAPFPAMSFGAALTAPVTVKRALKVCAIVGTILVAINHGDVIAAGGAPPVWKIILTYLVPYSVSSYSPAAFIADYGARKTAAHAAASG